MVCYDRAIFGRDTIIWKIWNLRVQKNLNIEKIAFKVVQKKFLAMHITDKKLSFDIFMVVHLLFYIQGNVSLFNILMIFGIKKWYLRLVLSRVTLFFFSNYKITTFQIPFWSENVWNSL